jgi:hypothetical protein
MRRSLVLVVAVLTVLGVPAVSHAGTSTVLYSYDLAGSAGVVPDLAAAGGAVPLILLGDWSPGEQGVLFAGDLLGDQSVGVAKPGAGRTLDVNSATTGVGGAVVFRYTAPAGGCGRDSVNLTQIGRFGTNITQLKLQLSKCGEGATHVQCRMVGNVSRAGTLPVRSSMALADGGLYVAQCLKGPDPSTGKATLQLRVVRLDAAGEAVNSFAVPRTGTMRSTAYLSVANKYPLTVQSRNSDQFVGEVLRVAYCTGSSAADVRTCLDQAVA